MQEAGLAEVLWANQQKDDLRHFISSFILLGFNLILTNFIGSSECDLELCQRILDENLEKYPDGAFFSFFKGRHLFVQGQIEESLSWYKRSAASQDDWPQFHHICYWELYWGNMFMQNWRDALEFGDHLLEESRWSKCMYAYQKASTMCMMYEELSPKEKEELVELMR